MKRSYRRNSHIKNTISSEQFTGLQYLGKTIVLRVKNSSAIRLELITAVSLLENLQSYFKRYPADYVTGAACSDVATAEELPSDTEAAYAAQLLYSRAPDPDLPGATIPVPSPIHKTYLTDQLNYQSAVSEFRRASEAAMASSSPQQAWPVLAPTFKASVDDAWDELVSGGAAQVERALLILDILSKGEVARSERFVTNVASVSRSPTPPNVELWLTTSDAAQDARGELLGYAFTIHDASAIKCALERIVGVIAP